MTEPGKVRAPLYFLVPASARWEECKCGARIYWITTKRGKSMPVNCDLADCYRPQTRPRADGSGNDLLPGKGISHFADCPRAAEFRSRR